MVAGFFFATDKPPGTLLICFIIAKLARNRTTYRMKKKALIIGGGSDMGSAIIKRLSSEYEVSYTYRTCRDYLPDGDQHRLDITHTEEIAALFERIGPLDLVATASFPYINTSLDSFDDYLMMEPYLRGYVAIFAQSKKHLKKGGLLVNLLGQSADYGLPSAPHYGASFAYLDNLAKSYNARYGRTGEMNVFNLQLGPVETSLWAGVSKDERKYFEDRVSSFIEPSEVAELVYNIAQMKVVPTKLVLDGYFSLPI